MLGIAEGLHEPSLTNFLETALYYNLNELRAKEVIKTVITVVSTWRARAKALHIAMADVEEMDAPFITELEQISLGLPANNAYQTKVNADRNIILAENC